MRLVDAIYLQKMEGHRHAHGRSGVLSDNVLLRFLRKKVDDLEADLYKTLLTIEARTLSPKRNFSSIGSDRQVSAARALLASLSFWRS